MIDEITVQKIIDAAGITDVVQEFVPLKKRGVNYLGLCPFHNEKTPSFTVSPAKGIYKCFGCGKGGNSVNFIMEHEQLSYVEALKYLAQRFNIEIIEKELSPEQLQQKNERESLLVVTQYAQKYFTETLHEHKDGKAIGLSYFKERGFREDIIEKFQLGYCLDQRNEFTKTALKNGYKLDFLTKTGLTIDKNGNTFDRFFGRVMFPIHGLSGKVIAFGGRTLRTDKKSAKYLNSPESEIYHKSNVLYGIYQAKNPIVKNDKCYLVEGYTDVISMHQSNVENVVASSGTSLTVPQIRLIKRFTNNITILYDGDAAGIKASLRGIDLILEEGLNVRVLLFPDGEDPDSFSKKIGASELMEYINNNEKDFITFKTELLLKDVGNDPVKKANLITNIVSSIAVIPEKPMRLEYISQCSNILKVDEEMLHYEVNKRLNNKANHNNSRQSYSPEPAPVSYEQPKMINSQSEAYEKEVIRLLLNYGSKELFKSEEEEQPAIAVAQYITSEIANDDLVLLNPTYNLIFTEYATAINEGKLLEEKYFINHTNREISKLAADLLSTSYVLSEIHRKGGVYIATEDMRLNEIVPATIMSFKNYKVMEMIKEARELLRNLDPTTPLEEITEIMNKLMILEELKKNISKEIGGRIIL